jgi:hypothetical protein
VLTYFNDASSVSNHIAYSERLIGELRIRKDMKGSGRGLGRNVISEFFWKEYKKP